MPAKMRWPKKISELEIELRGNDKEFKRLFEEKTQDHQASPSLRTIFDAMNQRR
jgi:hypothetical protein